MANKHLSVIIVPHTKTSTKTLCFSRKMLKILASAASSWAWPCWPCWSITSG